MDRPFENSGERMPRREGLAKVKKGSGTRYLGWGCFFCGAVAQALFLTTVPPAADSGQPVAVLLLGAVYSALGLLLVLVFVASQNYVSPTPVTNYERA